MLNHFEKSTDKVTPDKPAVTCIPEVLIDKSAESESARVDGIKDEDSDYLDTYDNIKDDYSDDDTSDEDVVDKDPLYVPKNDETENKQDKCKICLKFIPDAGVLKEHEQTHKLTGRNRYMCEHCEKQYSKKISLVKHLKVSYKVNKEANMVEL